MRAPYAASQIGALGSAAVVYAWLLSRGSFDPFGEERFGLVFNSMLDHMLRGRWDVDPASIGFEAFVRDGAAYAYFGPFPALLRLPLTLAPEWRGLHVERLSCWLAVMLGIAAQTRAILVALGPAGQRFAPPLVWTCALSGPPMLLGWKGALIYHEALLWSWALAAAFVALAMPAVMRPGPVGWRRLCGLAACAGLCLLTRSTTGAGLYLATGLLVLSGSTLRRAFWAPAGVLAAFLAVTGVVNQGRWGHPLVFANLRLQTALVDAFPDRLARLDRHGLFIWDRLDTGLLYYVFPVWTDGLERLWPLQARLADLYDAIEQPASSLLLTDPVWCLFSVLGVIALVRRRATARAGLLTAGLSLTPILILSAWYLAFRYRPEFAPLLLALSCIGLADRAPGFVRGRMALWALCVLQIAGAAAAGQHYATQPFGPADGYAAFSLRCVATPSACDPP